MNLPHHFMLLSLVLLLPGIASAETSEWIGRKFMPRQEATFKVRAETVSSEAIPLPLVPTVDRNKWVWVGSGWVKKIHLIPMEEAANYYSQLSAKEPHKPWPHYHLAATQHSQGNIAEALAGYSKVIQLDPQFPAAYLSRGNIYIDQGDADRAISDFTTALRLKPESSEAFNLRGVAHGAKNNYDRALQDFGSAVRLNPANTTALNNRGWMLATCPDDQYRSGKQALADATKACELTKYNRPEILDTLAAAAAETGDFAAAIRWIEKALELVPVQSETHKSFSERLSLYQNSKPYRLAK
ncbi:Tetratricopeptide TPR_2 repeat protein [Pirellula staleyi DSM 6068]|uniref:Tetratricopeptide TPR_2 repeat protein n=1 Tax=Pirellula staleyi (strain ATCC 27377 / DSM 6068 / ICPB 4128) TaxID=530564 RepID=D2QWH0_PIRSD|nr:tetratricopeptide repeat protein [Pirellula staleyi]ADB17773.1 Tetratricopeptide TPR_2 repeat protein [Pirellula staleyi DSM 6068]